METTNKLKDINEVLEFLYQEFPQCIKEKDEGESRALARTNERLKRLGKEPVENLDDIPEVIEELDPFLEEAALITQDYIKYGRIAKK